MRLPFRNRSIIQSLVHLSIKAHPLYCDYIQVHNDYVAVQDPPNGQRPLTEKDSIDILGSFFCRLDVSWSFLLVRDITL